MRQAKARAVEKFSVGLALSLLALTAALQFRLSILYITIACLASFALPFFLSSFISHYRSESRKRSMEKKVPDLLLQASVFSKATPAVEIISSLANSSFGALSLEFRQAWQEIDKGASVDEALNNIKARNHSVVLSRAINLLVQGYRSGASMSSAFKEAAEDILETQSIFRERQAAMAIEKYTLLFSAAFIVPMVLGIVSRLVKSLNLSSLTAFSPGSLNALERAALMEAALQASQVYVVEFALLAALFIALQESNLQKAFLYALALVPASLAFYFLARFL